MPPVANLNGLLLSTVPIQSHIPNAVMLATGPLDFSAGTAYVLDLSSVTALREGSVQSIYIDAYNCAGITTVTVTGTQHVIKVLPFTEGYFPLFVTGKTSIMFQNDVSGGALAPALVSFYLTNVPMVAHSWNTRADPFNKILYGNFQVVSPNPLTQNLALASSGQIYSIRSIRFWLEVNQQTLNASPGNYHVYVSDINDGPIFGANWAIPASGAALQTFPDFMTPGNFLYTATYASTFMTITASIYTLAGVNYEINYGYL